MCNHNRPTLSIEELEATQAWKALNVQQQGFVRVFAETGDQFMAFSQNYTAPSAETARKGSYAVMSRASVRRAIDAFLKKSERELFIEEVRRVSRSKKVKPAQLRALELRAAAEFGIDLKSLRKESANASSQKS
jgi:hypothetical protein